MRVGFVLYGDLSIRTGGFLYDRMLVAGLKERGVQIEVLALPWKTYGSSLLEGLRMGVLPAIAGRDLELLLQDELAHPSLFRANRVLRERSGIPIVALVHHLRSSENHHGLLKSLYRWIESLYASSVDGFIANSEATLASVQALTGEAVPALVAQPGRDHFQPELTREMVGDRAREPGPLRMLFLGSVIPRKGLHDLIGALKMTALQDFRLVVIGRERQSSTYVHQIHRAIDRAGFSERIHWLGERSDVEVARALKDVHILVMPSSYEGFGIAYLDAMGYGVVPIGTTAGGAGSLIQHGVNGFLIDPGDRQRLATLIERLGRDRQELTRLAMNAYDRYRKHPTWKEVSHHVHAYLKLHSLSKRMQ